MHQEKKDLTEGALGKQILFFSIPLMLSNVLQVLFNMADVAVVGRFAGPIALGAVGSTTILVALFTGLLIGMSGGVNVLVALHYGAGSKKDVEETTHTAAILCLLAGVLLTVIGITCANGILSILNTKPELIDDAALYLRIYFLGMPALAMYNYGNAVFSAVGDTKRPLCYLSVAGIINILLNLFFVIICHLDVAGVAMASVISQYLSAFLIVSVLFRSKEIYGLRFSMLRVTPGKARSIVRIGVPAGLQNGIFQLANLFIQKGVNSFDATMVAGNSAAANADAVVYDVMAAFYTACGSFIGQNYGAGKRTRIIRSYFVSLAYSFGVGLLLGLLLVACGPHFLALFTKEEAVMEAGMMRLTIMGFSYCISAFMDCTIAASRGLGKSFVPTLIVFMGSCVFRIIWVYTIFAYFETITSLYLLYAFSWSITAFAEILYFYYIYKKQVGTIVIS
ncbi:MAG: MATE family efflux transporter [Lachnospiraceae bacterium]|nr:MATE family efflux transporter [Lachnospiraceae bacterium]